MNTRALLLSFLALAVWVAIPMSTRSAMGADDPSVVSVDHDHADGDHDHGDDAHGEGEHHDEGHAETPLLSFDVGSAIWNLIIFLCVLAILSKFVWPSVLGGLQAREEKIREDLQAAEKANADAKSLLADYQAKLDEASTQVQTMLADARRDAEAAGQKIVAEAKEEAAAQRERAVADIDNAKKVAMSELAGQTSDLAMKVARGVVGRELSATDHADLIRQAMDQVPSQN
ncbi:MAG: F0F1 ATP synthase subunit B [Planctomycetota bacterium]